MVTNFVWPLYVPCNIGFEDLLVLKSTSGNEGGICPNKVRGILNGVCLCFYSFCCCSFCEPLATHFWLVTMCTCVDFLQNLRAITSVWHLAGLHSAYWASPELIIGEAYGRNTDIWYAKLIALFLCWYLVSAS